MVIPPRWGFEGGKTPFAAACKTLASPSPGVRLSERSPRAGRFGER